MDFRDATTLKLATAAGRQAMLDQVTLGSMVAAAFDTGARPVQGPFGLEVETVDLGLELVPAALAEGTVRMTPGGPPVELRVRVEGLAIAPRRVDALWRGTLVARLVPEDGRVAAVGGGFAGPPAGEGAVSGATTAMGTFRVAFSLGPPAAAPVPVALPVTVAVLVRDTPLQVSALLAESRTVRTILGADASVQPGAAALRRRTPVLVLWAVPSAMWDGPDWPGATRDERRTAAAELLAGQGIALASA